jgi:DNA-binding beta-propeller fold protein YncE
MRILFRAILVGLLTAISGCFIDISGEPPPGDELVFPVGLTTTENDVYLLVANSNFDLRYNAGTVIAISLDKLEDYQKNGGDAEWESPDGKFLYVPEEVLVDPNDTIRIGSFASDLEMTPDFKRAIVPVRGGKTRAIVIIDVDEFKANGRLLNCGQGKDLQCNKAHRVESNDRFTLPIEPYEVTSLVDEQTLLDEDGNETVHRTVFGFATHLYSGDVSAFTIENSNGDLAAELIAVSHDVVPEASGIAASDTGEIYVAGRSNADKYIAVMRLVTGSTTGTLTNNPFFGLSDKINYVRDIYGGTDARGIAVDPDPAGNNVLVVTRTPEALLRFDTQSQSRGLVDLTTLGSDPSVVGVFYDEETGKSYAFVLCYASNQIYIVEPELMQVYVRTTGTGPQAVAFDKKRKLAYIANFRESTISIIQAVPPFDHLRVEGKKTRLMIGRPHLSKENR